VAFLLSYVTLAGVAGYFAQRHYAMAYEGGRIARVLIASAVATAIALAIPSLPPLAGFLVRGSTTVAVFVGFLWIAGFMRPTERALVLEFWSRTVRVGR
jgi:hypothetical protein